MKQYLKMKDVFRDVAQPERFNYAMANPKATYAAHAINSHDELVQMNQELLAALEDLWSDVEYAYDGFRGARISADKVVEIISKAKGGAA